MNDPREDDYLWDKRGPPDADSARLEQQLGTFRAKPGTPDPSLLDAEPHAAAAPGGAPGEASPAAARPLPLRPIRWHRWLGRTLAAAALLFAAFATWHGYAESHEPVLAPGRYRFEPLAGRAVLERLDGAGASVPVARLDGGARVDGARAVEPGHRVVTEADAHGRLVVGDIGSVVLEGGSRLRVEEAAALPGDDAQYALYLERGTLQASIFAAPRIFQVGTPSGIAVDMGCSYRTTVDDDGRVTLSVTMGQVSFETVLADGSRTVLVPEGASCRAWPGRGAGTPVWDDAPDEYKDAVEVLDAYDPAAPDGLDEHALKEVLGGARAKDGLTLWHLLAHEHDVVRASAYDRLAALSPPPEGVTRDALLAGDESMREAWRRKLGFTW